MEIREARLEDAESIERLWYECELVMPYNPPQRDIGLCLTSESSRLFLACVDGQIVGSVMTGYDGHRGWLYYLATAPQFRRRGVARRLVQHAEDWIKSRGVRKIQLMVRPTNQGVIGFYERLGYAQTPMTILARWLEADS